MSCQRPGSSIVFHRELVGTKDSSLGKAYKQGTEFGMMFAPRDAGLLDVRAERVLGAWLRLCPLRCQHRVESKRLVNLRQTRLWILRDDALEASRRADSG